MRSDKKLNLRVGNTLNQITQCILLSACGLSAISQYVHAQDVAAETTSRPTQSDEVVQLETVTATTHLKKKKAIAAGTLGSRSNLETPFAATSVDSKKIEDKQAKSIGKLFESEAGVAAKGNTYSLNAYALSVRGLPLDYMNGYKIDGHPFQMYGVELPLEFFEQVQLLKGATGFLYGIGSPGGTLNYISKKPTNGTTFSVDAGYSSDSIFTQHVDVGGHFGTDDRYGYRVNLVNEHGEAYNGTKVDRKAASVYLDAQITPSLKAYANGLYQERDLKGGITTISVGGSGSYAYSGSTLPAAISGRKNLTAYDNTSYYNSKVWAAAAGLNWDINDTWKLDTSYSHTFKQIESADETLYLRNPQGDYNVALRQFYRPTLVFDSVQSHLQGDFETGWLKHKVVAGLEWQRQTRDLNIGDPSLDPATSTGGQNYVYPATGTYPSGNLYDASLNLAYNGSAPRQYFRISNWWTQSAFLSDTLSIGNQWSLLLGVRSFDYSNKNYYVSGALRSAYHEKPVSPTYALLFKPNANTTFYTSYVESLEDGGTVGSTYANAYAQLAPIESKQYEVGVKTEYRDWSLSSALFRIERGTGYANSQNDYVNDGVVRYDGFEMNGLYRPVQGLTLTAGGSWTNAQYTEGAASVIGRQPTAVPHFQGNLGVAKQVDFFPGLELHSNLNYVGKQYVNTANTLQTSDFETVSIGGSYKVALGPQHQLTYRAEISNLFNKKYWIASADAVSAGALTVGAPRTLSLNIRYDY